MDDQVLFFVNVFLLGRIRLLDRLKDMIFCYVSPVDTSGACR